MLLSLLPAPPRTSTSAPPLRYSFDHNSLPPHPKTYAIESSSLLPCSFRAARMILPTIPRTKSRSRTCSPTHASSAHPVLLACTHTATHTKAVIITQPHNALAQEGSAQLASQPSKHGSARPSRPVSPSSRRQTRRAVIPTSSCRVCLPRSRMRRVVRDRGFTLKRTHELHFPLVLSDAARQRCLTFSSVGTSCKTYTAPHHTTPSCYALVGGSARRPRNKIDDRMTHGLWRLSRRMRAGWLVGGFVGQTWT